MKAPRSLSKTEEMAFDRLMKAYPPRGDNPRAPARKVFAELMDEGVDAEALVSAAVRYAEVIKAERRERRMIPHTRKWLFQRYFEDSGLFGTVEDALDRVESLKRIGVTAKGITAGNFRINSNIASEVVRISVNISRHN